MKNWIYTIMAAFLLLPAMVNAGPWSYYGDEEINNVPDKAKLGIYKILKHVFDDDINAWTPERQCSNNTSAVIYAGETSATFATIGENSGARIQCFDWHITDDAATGATGYVTMTVKVGNTILCEAIIHLTHPPSTSDFAGWSDKKKIGPAGKLFPHGDDVTLNISPALTAGRVFGSLLYCNDVATATLTYTQTNTPTWTPTTTKTTTSTVTETNTATYDPTVTSTSTHTGTSTNTPTQTLTHTETKTRTITETTTPTTTPTITQTITATNTATNTQTSTPDATPTYTPTLTATCTTAVLLGTGNINASSYSGSFTYGYQPPVGSNKLLIVKITQTGSNPDTVTYGGSGMTAAYTYNPFGTLFVSVWYLADPGSTTQNIQVSDIGFHNYQMAVLTYGGVDQADPIGAITPGSAFVAFNATYTTSITTDQSYSTITDMLFGNNGDIFSLSAGAGQTQEYGISNNFPSSIYGSNKTADSAGAQTLTYENMAPGGRTYYNLAIEVQSPCGI